jgi:hypothetical protein
MNLGQQLELMMISELTPSPKPRRMEGKELEGPMNSLFHYRHKKLDATYHRKRKMEKKI